ncbi:MAG: hypothetical protein AUJ12_01260 [Alphaproteobacteria bacterium CG1_02_46_17]|nr:MAG: hypothetical protein AUJ12_01260 [Alphaproteobacteria bacterium CG1_02_46_17]
MTTENKYEWGQFRRSLTDLEHVKVLIVEDSDIDFYLVERIMAHKMPWACDVIRAETIQQAEGILKDKQYQIDIVLLDLGLPDSASPQDTYQQLSRYKDQCPIVILTSIEDHLMALEMLGIGAQDYVCKNMILMQPELLVRIMEFSIGRHRSLKSSRVEMEQKLAQTSELLNLMSGSYSAG